MEINDKYLRKYYKYKCKYLTLKQKGGKKNRPKQLKGVRKIPEDIHPTWGKKNPHLLDMPTWKFMILNDDWEPEDLRDMFRYDEDDDYLEGPVFSFFRHGRTVTELEDGSKIYIGGEQEAEQSWDHYIYNDVVVVKGDEIKIYGYPTKVFPPINFHSATLVGDKIWIIGGLGREKYRDYGKTPVWTLDLKSMKIEPKKVTGQVPGWVFGHKARLYTSPMRVLASPSQKEEGEDHQARVINGKIVIELKKYMNKEGHWIDSNDVYELDLDSLVFIRK